MPETGWLRSLRPFVLAGVTAASLASLAGAEPVITLQQTGSSANRLDVAILGDGYTTGEMAKYAADVNALVGQLFNEEPFRTYRSVFNVHRVEVVSAESGADKPVEGVFRNTSLGAFYYCGGIDRLICVDSIAVNNVLAASLRVDQRDLVVILVNDTTYGGSGGAYAVLSLHPSSTEIARHEIGHTLGLLADEYVTGPPPPCNTSFEPIEANATLRTTRALIKWAAWIEDSTPIPTLSAQPGVPGLYQGGKYCVVGMYRPTFDSKMRSLGRPFEQINTEQLTKRIYNFVSPIDSASPFDAIVSADLGELSAFEVRTPELSHAFQVSWEVDGQSAGSGLAITIDTGQLGRGTHQVRVTVSDPTAFVRNDPGDALRASEAWLLRVLAAVDGDVDGDRAVTCGDVQVVQSAFGKRRGATGFDPRADWNDDAVISVYDLAYVARRLAAGTDCRQ